MRYPEIRDQGKERELEAGSDPDVSIPKSPTVVSNMSGTTARNSRSLGRPKDVSADDLLDTLPGIARAARDISNLLLPKAIDKDIVSSLLLELQNSESRQSKKLRLQANVFQAHRDSISMEDIYFDVHSIRKSLVGARVPDLDENAPWQPDNVLFQINLASLMLLMTRNYEKGPDLELIEELDRVFPTPFVSGLRTKSNVEESKDIDNYRLAQTFDLARGLRAQAAILRLARQHDEQDFDPEGIIRQYYYNESTQTLKGWDVHGLQETELTEEQQSSLLDHVNSLQAMFADDANNDLFALKDFYPWTSFVTDVFHWIAARQGEINELIESQGGIDTIVEQLGSQVQRKQTAQTDPNIDPALVDGTSPVQMDFSSHSVMSRSTSMQTEDSRPSGNMIPQPNFQKDLPRNVARLKELAAVQNQAKVEKQQTQGSLQAEASLPSRIGHDDNQAQNVEDVDWVPPPIEDDLEDAPQGDDVMAATDAAVRPVDQEFIKDIINRRRGEESASNKENVPHNAGLEEYEEEYPGLSRRALAAKGSFIDPQPHATRITFDDESQRSFTLPSSSGQSRKRKGLADDDDGDIELSQDQGFQTHNQPVDVEVRRRAKPVQRKSRTSQIGIGRSPKRTRIIAPEDTTGIALTSAEAGPSGVHGIIRSTAEVHRKANEQAKMVTSLHASKPAQTRTPWSEEETTRLFDLMMEHGTSWKELKQIDALNGEVLISRDQVSLKDKARNMKVDFLK